MISYKSHVEVESNDNMKLTRPHVAAGDSLPGAGQHLQLRVCQCSQGIPCLMTLMSSVESWYRQLSKRRDNSKYQPCFANI